MKLELIAHSKKTENNFVYTDFFIEQDYKFLFLTYFKEKSKIANDINMIIFNYLTEIDISNIAPEAILSSLRERFENLNLLIYAKIKKSIIDNPDISLTCLISIKDKHFLINFGEFSASYYEKGKTKHIKPSSKLFIGKSIENIEISISEVPMSLHSSLICGVFGSQEKEILSDSPSITQNIEFVKRFGKENRLPFFIVKAEIFKKAPKAIVLRIRKRVIASIMAIIIILSTIYVFYGKNWLADQQNVLKAKNSDFMRNELLEKLVETQETLNKTMQELYDLNLIPEQKLSIRKIREYVLNDEITQQPLFDTRYIYVVTKESLFAYKKRGNSIRWQKEIQNIIELELLDANRLLVTSRNGRIVCLNRETGIELWDRERKIGEMFLPRRSEIKQIMLNRFQQLDSSLLIVPAKSDLYFLNNINGDSLFSYHSMKKIKFVSNFDVLEKSLYVVEDKKIIQLKLDLKIK